MKRPMILAAKDPQSAPLFGSGFVEAVEAADGADGSRQAPKVSIVAYNGGTMTVRYWGPVVLDLEGAELPDQIKLLVDHDQSVPGVIGHATAEVRGDKVYEAGVLSYANPLTDQIVQLSKDGVRFEASVGIDPLKWEEIAAGESVTVNGKKFQATGCGLTVIRVWRLKETSLLPFGADDRTSVNIAARRADTTSGGMDMGFEAWLTKHGIKAADLSDEEKATLRAAFDAGQEPPAEFVQGGDGDGKDGKDGDPPPANAGRQPTQPGQGEPPADPLQAARGAIEAERERVAGIQDLCAGEFPEIEREAIRAGSSIEQVSQKLLAALRDRRPQAGPGITVLAPSQRESSARAIEAALCLRAGVPEEQLVKAYGEQVMEAAYPARGIALQEVMLECARMEGKTIPRAFGNDTIRAAFSTVSLPGILNNVANKSLMRAYQMQPIAATRLCSEGDLVNFKESERYRLTDVGDLKPVAPDGELEHGGQTEEKATNQLETYGKVFFLTRKMIFDDDLGAFLRIPTAQGARAGRLIDQLFFTRLLSNPTMEDGHSLFDATNHANYAEGATTALDSAALGTAVQMFMDQVDADGQPINIAARFLLVPSALKQTGSELLNSSWLVSYGGTSAKTRQPTYNAMADEDLVLVSSPYLANSNYTGYSAKAWYLFGDPALVDTFEIGYLRGRRTPTVEQGDTDFNNLGMGWRVYFDVGIREQDWRGIVKMKGEA